MGTRVTTTEGKSAIFDSVTGLPVHTPVFDDEDQAEAFIQFVSQRCSLDIRAINPSELDEWRTNFHKQAEVDAAVESGRSWDHAGGVAGTGDGA
jgi:hypothetical protein